MKVEKEAKDYQKMFFRSVIQIVDFDRERISKNVHDEVGTILSIIKLNLSKIARNSDDVELTKKLLEESMSLLERTIQQAREISKDLMPPTLLKLGYEKGVLELCKQISASNEIKIIVNHSQNEIRLFPVIESQIYRVMQEILNNIIKHANATEINVKMKTDEKEVITEVLHNGIGLNSENVSALLKSNNGVGLKSIHKQLELIDATIDYNTNGNGESTIIIKVPRHEENN